jgi:hypothetical protein
MRLFLAVMLFFIVYRPLCILYPWTDWAEHLKVPDMPERLPTRAERQKLASEASDARPFPVTTSVLETLDSVWDFFKPWPNAQTRQKLRTGQDYAAFAVCWVNSRAQFFEYLLNYNTEWAMFTPSTSKYQDVPRARLIFADGSQQEVRGRTEPADVTDYFRWFEVRMLNYEFKVEEGRWRPCAGYCHWLAHRYATNDAGAPLKTIRLFSVRYDLPQPGTDARAAWAAQQGPAKEKVRPDFYEYDVASRNGKLLDTK